MSSSTPHTGKRRSFGSDFRLFFLRGLAILLPSVLTLWLLWYAYQFVAAKVAEPINAGVRQVITAVGPRIVGLEHMPAWHTVAPEQIVDAKKNSPLSEDALARQIRSRQFAQWWNEHYLRAIGLVVAIVLIYLAGMLLGGILGRGIYRRLEELLTRVPIFKQVYPYVKQVVDFLLGENQKVAFKKVVLVEYPRKGIWSIGLVTGAPLRPIESCAGGECVTVFVPSSPTPFTGYTVTVPRAEAIDLPMTIDEAIRFVVTGGVLTPDRFARADPPAAPLPPAGNLAVSPGPGMMEPDLQGGPAA